MQKKDVRLTEWRVGQRLTKKYLTNWINQKMIDLEIPVEVVKIEHTRLRGHEYECGAAVYIVTVKGINNEDKTTYFYIFDHIKNMEHWLNQGYRLKFEPENRFTITGSYITLAKY